MLSVSVRKKIHANNMSLSELQQFIGKNVIITITEEQRESQKLEKFKDFFNLSGKIFIDEESIKLLREKSRL